MTIALDVSRRGFLAGSAAAGTGLSLGFPTEVAAQGAAATAAPEVNAWVVIRPDDTIVVRVARSEMGQGTLTGLAQLVVEELEGDWSKVTTESITAAQNLARNRVWGEMGTGGSRGIRISQDYVRRGGAAARLCCCRPRPTPGRFRSPRSASRRASSRMRRPAARPPTASSPTPRRA